MKEYLQNIAIAFLDWLTSPAGRLAYMAFARSIAKVIAGALVASGYLETGGGWESTVLGVLLFIGTEGFTQYSKWSERQKLVTAMASQKATTETQIEAKIAIGEAASVTTRKDEVPRIISAN